MQGAHTCHVNSTKHVLTRYAEFWGWKKLLIHMTCLNLTYFTLKASLYFAAITHLLNRITQSRSVVHTNVC